MLSNFCSILAPNLNPSNLENDGFSFGKARFLQKQPFRKKSNKSLILGPILPWFWSHFGIIFEAFSASIFASICWCLFWTFGLKWLPKWLQSGWLRSPAGAFLSPKTLPKRIRDATSIFYRIWVAFASILVPMLATFPWFWHVFLAFLCRCLPMSVDFSPSASLPLVADVRGVRRCRSASTLMFAIFSYPFSSIDSAWIMARFSIEFWTLGTSKCMFPLFGNKHFQKNTPFANESDFWSFRWPCWLNVWSMLALFSIVPTQNFASS